MAQFSVKIMRPTGSVLGENQHAGWCARVGRWPTASIRPPISPPRTTPGPASAGSDRAVSTCRGIGVRHAAAVRKRHRRCRGCNNSPGKTGPATRAGPALRSAVAQRRAGICRTAPGAAGSTATMTASPARASAERDSGGPASRRGVVSPAMAAGSSVHCG